MQLIACIFVGIIAGWLAERMTGRDHGLLTNLVVGVLGSLIGGFIATSLIGLRYEEGFNIANLPQRAQVGRAVEPEAAEDAAAAGAG